MLNIYSKIISALLIGSAFFSNVPAHAGCATLGEKVSAPASLSAQDIKALKPYFTLLRRYAKSNPVRWESHVLKSGRPLTEARALEIVDQLFDAKSALRVELDAKFLPSFKVPNAEMWNLYFGAYDNVVGFSDGYLSIFLNAAQLMNKHSFDLGGGTGNFPAIQEALYPGKEVDSVDSSSTGFAAAKQKLNDLAKDGQADKRFKFFQRSLLSDWTLDMAENSYDGAVMNNVLYNIADKATVLNSVYKILKPGSYFVLNDPLNTIVDETAVRNFFAAILKDALRNNSPVTEYDLALLGYINVMFLTAKGGASTFLTLPELAAKAKASGFEVVKSFSSYYQMGSFLVLRKPL